MKTIITAIAATIIASSATAESYAPQVSYKTAYKYSKSMYGEKAYLNGDKGKALYLNLDHASIFHAFRNHSHLAWDKMVAHKSGITGKGVKIRAWDYGDHGARVAKVISEFAPDADISVSNSFKAGWEGSWVELQGNADGGFESHLATAISERYKEFDEVTFTDHLGVSKTYKGNARWAYKNHSDIVNLSISDTYNAWRSDIALNKLDKEVNATLDQFSNGNQLFTISAGNQRSKCQSVNHCNGYASALIGDITNGDFTRNEDNTTIVAGSIDAHKGGWRLHDYSNAAGILMNDYLSVEGAAHGSALAGTSFTAPQVAGVAALVMDKFDTNALQTKNILLNSAIDIGAKGTDAVFGRGLLNLHGALSPLGGLK